jgi:hypothetical protein
LAESIANQGATFYFTIPKEDGKANLNYINELSGDNIDFKNKLLYF